MFNEITFCTNATNNNQSDKEHVLMKEKKVSVIVPVYKVEKYLAKCVKSIINQTYKNIEIILVDDGSPDCCPKICDCFANQDIRVKVIHKANGGLSSARNAGVNIATGDYLMFIDGDDYIDCLTIEKALSAMIQKKVDLVIFGLQCVDENDNVIPCAANNLPESNLWDSKDFWFNYNKNRVNAVVAWNKLYKRKLFYDLKFEEGRIHEDEFIIHHILKKCEHLYYLSEPLYYYVQRSNSIMKNKNDTKSLIDSSYAFMDRIKALEDKKIISNTFCQLLEKFYLIDYSRLEDKYINDYRTLKIFIRKESKIIKKSSFNLKTKIKILLAGSHPIVLIIAKKVKNILLIAKIYWAKFKFSRNDKYIKLKKNKENKIFLMDTPNHGNLGDQAIAIAELQHLQHFYPAKNIFEFTHLECTYNLNQIKHFFRKNDVLIIHGGGFIGSIWKKEHKVLIKILKKFNKFKIVIYPQTVFFKPEDFHLQQVFLKIVNHCKHLTICVRDRKSYDFLLKNKVFCNLLFVPDIVLSMKYNHDNKNRKKVLLCFRKDLERVSSYKNVVNILDKANIIYDFTDTVIEHNVTEKDRKKEVEYKLSQFSSYQLVICDRLHALIFSTITSTPCIAFDNISKKISGVFEWIKKIDFITCINEDEFSLELVNEYIKKSRNSKCDLTYLYTEFEKIKLEVCEK